VVEAFFSHPRHNGCDGEELKLFTNTFLKNDEKISRAIFIKFAVIFMARKHECSNSEERLNYDHATFESSDAPAHSKNA
jgi:hypothetical protein